MDHIFRLTADEEQIIQTTLQNPSDLLKPERQQTNLSASEQILQTPFDQGQTDQSATLELNSKEERKPTFHSSQCNSSVSQQFSGPGALVTELISEDDIETVILSDEQTLTIEVSVYAIPTLYQCYLIKGMVHPKMEILSSFIQPHV